jgi:hypothetical protein
VSPAGSGTGRAPAVDEPRCSITELIASQCAHCRRLPDPPVYGRWYRAKTTLVCRDCGDDIESGDRVRAAGHGGVVCEDCGTDHA